MRLLWIVVLSCLAIGAEPPECVERSLNSRNSSDVRALFDEAQQYAREGRYRTARVAFETLVAVYPESCLVAPARETMASIDEREDVRLIRAVRFDGLRRVSAQEALDRFDQREIGLAADMRYEQDSVEEAKGILRDMLAEKGLPNAHVTASTKTIAPRQVEVTFHIAPAHRRLIGMLRLP